MKTAAGLSPAGQGGRWNHKGRSGTRSALDAADRRDWSSRLAASRDRLVTSSGSATRAVYASVSTRRPDKPVRNSLIADSGAHAHARHRDQRRVARFSANL